MSEYRQQRRPAIVGMIRHRLLVNALVDPDEAAHRLPNGLRPHVTNGGTIVGCCLLALDDVRPAGVPSRLGLPLVAAAHRIAAEWDGKHGATTIGVYVPMRHATSWPAQLAGGRWFPGVHLPASIRTTFDDERQYWAVEPRHVGDRYAIEVHATVAASPPTPTCEPIGGTCLAAAIGVSPDRCGTLEAARMEPEHRAARPVEIGTLNSQFLAGFTSVRPATSYLMRDVHVRWSRAAAPLTATLAA